MAIEIPQRFVRYIEYIRNIGGSPKVTWFDEDWEPLGPTLRHEMVKIGLIVEKDGKLYLTDDIVKG